ncbi:MAG: PAS domain S-box protein [Desulfobacteraceae bacterium]|nr:PAS domain S-box protein [Desulfobacteraceae bacterium]
MRESEANLRAIFDLTGVAIAVSDTRGKWIYNNKAMETMLGYSSEELRRLSNTEITYSDDIEPTKQCVMNLIMVRQILIG